jgi:N-methylhydantoinase A/oxoprolinase/acetone carboxylase beta subunit
MAIALGIDTGGTYTDAVLVEYESGRIIASAKALTTKHDLAIGIRGAIERVLAAHPADICLVSVSTTLATNAIVEGKGAPIAALLLGYANRLDAEVNLARELGTDRYVLIAGGHTADGDEWEPLDLAAARAAIVEHAPHVAGFAVSGFFGTRNPSHELAVSQLITELTGLPVTCGHELTHRLDALRRATTVALNASLIPLLCNLMDAVECTMSEKDIHAPLMVVKGDGSLMEASVARARPIETILSGPAASVVGAQYLGDSAEAVVVDMGGTTTDIAVIRHGRPRLSEQGAQVGRWRTMVEAVDAQTVGLGGDSRVWFDQGRELCIGPQRIMPICLLAMERPEIKETLRRQKARAKGDEALDGEFLLLQRNAPLSTNEHPPFERELFAALREGPLSVEQVYDIMQHPYFYARYLERLEREGVLLRAGLTPSDAAHVLGMYADWDSEAATLAAELVGRRVAMDAETLCRQVVARTSERIAAEVVHKLLSDDAQDGHHDILTNHLIERALRPTTESSLECALTVRSDIVAIGAPVQTYFPRVSELLHSHLCIPHDAGVANALGAVVGSIVYRVHALVIPRDEEEVYRVHLPDQIKDFLNLADAVAYAEQHGRELARNGAIQSGAMEVRVQVERKDLSAPVAEGWGDSLYLQTAMEITAVGRPRLAS